MECESKGRNDLSSLLGLRREWRLDSDLSEAETRWVSELVERYELRRVVAGLSRVELVRRGLWMLWEGGSIGDA